MATRQLIYSSLWTQSLNLDDEVVQDEELYVGRHKTSAEMHLSVAQCVYCVSAVSHEVQGFNGQAAAREMIDYIEANRSGYDLHKEVTLITEQDRSRMMLLR